MHRQISAGFLSRRFLWLVLGSCACLILFWGNAFQNSQSSIETLYPQGDPDVLMHLRRVEQFLLSGSDFAMVSPDRYSGFPRVHDYPYAPFLDYMGVHFCRAYYLLFPESPLSFDRIAGWLPVLFGGTFILLFSWWIFFLLGSASLGILGGFCLASFPSFTFLFQYHALDHHFLESFFLWCWVICGSLVKSSPKCSRLSAFAGAVVWAFLIFSWTGSPLLVAIFAGFVCLARLLHPPFQAYAEFVGYSFLIGGGAAAAITCANTPVVWHHFRFSLLQPSFSFCGGLLILFFLKTCEWRPKLRAFVWAIGGLTIIGGGLFLFGDPVGYLTASHPIMQSIDELQSVLTGFLNTFKLRDLFRAVDPKFVLFPFAFAVAAVTFSLRQAAWLLFPALLATLLGLWQVRYFRWSTAFLIFSQMLFFAYILNKTGFLNGERLPRKLAVSLLCLPLLLLLAAGVYENPAPGVIPIYEPVVNASLWLRKNSPDPGGYADGSVPKYGVLAFWDLGNFISYYARRPAVCDNLQYGLDYMSRIFLAETASEASRLMDEGNIRYLMVNDLGSDIPMNLLPKVRDSRYHADGSIILEKPVEEKKHSAEMTGRTLYENLYQFSGLGNGSSTFPLSRFRLVYVSQGARGEKGLPPVKIFEHVAGAELQGQTSPGAYVTLSLNLTFPFYKREGQYKLASQADADGRYVFRVPYPTNTYGGGVQTGAAYWLNISTRDGKKYVQEVEISEEAVSQGKKGTVGNMMNQDSQK